MQRRGTLNAIATVALIVGTALTATAPASAAANATAGVAPEQRASVTPVTKSFTAQWSTFSVLPTSSTLHIVLPNAIKDFDMGDLTWGMGSSSGTAAVLGNSIDVPMPELAQRVPTSLSIRTPFPEAGVPHARDTVTLLASVMLADPYSNAPSYIDMALARPSYNDLKESYTGNPAPAIIVPGSPFVLDADAGFWTTESGANTDTPYQATVWIGDETSGSGETVTYSISPDGTQLVLDIPADLGGHQYSSPIHVRFYKARDWLDTTGRQFDLTLPTVLKHPITVTRVGGDDRYDVAINVSKQSFPQGAPVAYVVTGATFPDALTAGPAAVKEGGPLLLSDGKALQPAVRTELERLAPGRIVIVGGPASISTDVEQDLDSIAPTERIGRADRFEVGRNLAAAVFPDGANRVFVATGLGFPDALSAGAAAGSTRSPVLLVNGGSPHLDGPTNDALQALAPRRVSIVGGPASVPTTIETDLGSIAPTERFGGADRYEASRAVNLAAFQGASHAYLVTGSSFPDALTGSRWAGDDDVPLYTVHPDCVPAETLAALQRQGVSALTLIGGPATLSQAVFDLVPCTT